MLVFWSLDWLATILMYYVRGYPRKALTMASSLADLQPVVEETLYTWRLVHAARLSFARRDHKDDYVGPSGELLETR